MTARTRRISTLVGFGVLMVGALALWLTSRETARPGRLQTVRSAPDEAQAPPVWTAWKPIAALRTAPGLEAVRCRVASEPGGDLLASYAAPPLNLAATALESVFGPEDAHSALSQDASDDASSPAARRAALAAMRKAAEGRQPVRLVMGNAPHSGCAGRPSLPVIPSKLMLPQGRDVDEVKVTLGKKVTLEGKYFLLPEQKPVPLLPGVKPEYTPPDPAVYASNDPYPAARHGLANVQRRRGVSHVLINLNPVEYRPQSGEISYYESISLRVTTKPAQGGAALRYRPDAYRPLADGVDNPDVLATYAVSTAGVASRAVCDPAGRFQYVIVTSQALKAAPSNPAGGVYNFQDLLAFKATQGLSGTIVTVEQIYVDYPGRDRQEKIRNFITDAYNQWETDFVLLGGDADGANLGGETENAVVPVRILHALDVAKDNNIPSDLYYQCLDGIWDYNNDGVYGWPGDGDGGGEVDVYADVYIGRAMVSIAAHVSTFVEKTIRYANAGDAGYARNALMVGEQMGFGGASEFGAGTMDEIRTGGTFNGVTNTGFPDGFTVDTLYDSLTYAWSKTELTSKLNSNKYNQIHHMGHCSNSHLMRLDALTGMGDLAKVANSNLFFLYSQGCFPGSFDNWFYGSGGLYVNYDAIGEKLQRNNRYGMVAGVLNSRYGWGAYYSTNGPSTWFHREFVDAYFGEYILNLGAINADSHEDNAWRLSLHALARWCLYQTNLFGDPHLALNGLSRQPSLAYRLCDLEDASGGNGDSIANPGENVNLTVTLMNVGKQSASGVSATLSTSDAYITVTDNAANFGDIPGRMATCQALDPFAIVVSPSCPTPHQATFTLRMFDALGGAWTDSFTLTVYSSSRISGRVVRATGGAAIPGATVFYSGPTQGAATTAADGSYAFVAVNGGEYTVLARAAGYLDSEPARAAVPPAKTNLNFALGNPEIAVTPNALALTAEEGATATAPLTIHNQGDAKLTWSATPPVWCSVAPSTGSLAGGGVQTVTVAADASGQSSSSAPLAPGVYKAALTIASNDPDEAAVNIPVTFTVTPGPRFAYASMTVNDDAAAPSAGDGDSAPEPGETIELTLSVRNTGTVGASGLIGTLTSADSFATVVSATAAFPDAAPGAVITGKTPFVVRIGADCPNNRSLLLDLEIRDNVGRRLHVRVLLGIYWRCALSGRVTDLTTGAPIAGAVVEMRSSTSRYFLRHSTPVASDGTYAINGFSAGAYMVSAVAPGYASSPVTLTFPPDKQTRNFQLGLPHPTATPASLSQTLAVGQTATQHLTIGNVGNVSLEWTSGCDPLGTPSAYVVTTSDQAGGPAYAWKEIAGTGTDITSQLASQYEYTIGPFNLGFDFPFYGKSFDTFRVSRNGYLSFTCVSTSDMFLWFPAPFANKKPENIVAFFWSDLGFFADSSAWYKQVDADTLVLEFKKVRVKKISDVDARVTCQVILKSDGSMVFQYQSVGETWYEYSVGVANAEVTEGVTVAYNSPLLRSGMAVKLQPRASWLTVSPKSGMSPAGGVSKVTATFNAAGLAPGVHHTMLQAASQSTGSFYKRLELNVPVTLTVTASGNHAPIISSSWVDPNPATLGDNATKAAVIASDPDGDTLIYTWSKVSGPGTVSFTPNGSAASAQSTVGFGAAGTYKLRVTASDQKGGSDTSADITVLVIADSANRAPVANAQSVTTAENVSKAITLTGSDPDGDVLTFMVGNPSHGTLSGTPPTVTYKPAANYHGADTFTFKVNDGKVDSAAATVSITVRGAGDLNGDGIVNIDDLILVISHFGQSAGDPDWDARADANGDGVVNIMDLTLVTTNFGRMY